MKKDLKCNRCSAFTYRDSKTGLCANCYKDSVHHIAQEPAEAVQVDRSKQRTAAELSALKMRYNEALKTVERQEGELRAMNIIGQGLATYRIEPKLSSSKGEGTAIIVASDWHIEERVGAETGGLNTYNLEIAEGRIKKFFQAGVRLVDLLKQDLTIDTVVLALLGDFISGDIHDELVDTAELQPMHAIVNAQNHLVSGIQFILDHSDVNLVLPCHSGNHARTTKTIRFSAENGHSLEYLMYLHLTAYFRGEPRVKFIIPEGMHSYLDVYDTTIRFQHGHAIKYAGGVGGIYIPVNKAIAQWNKARHADLDVFGHFHQSRDGGNFICNGSLIGYNAFALSIKADFEQPKQQLFLLDKKRGRTCTWPILVN